MRAEIFECLIVKKSERDELVGKLPRLGVYTEFGNHYSSGHIQIGSACRF